MADDPSHEGNRQPGKLYDREVGEIVAAFVCCECFRGIMGPNRRCVPTQITMGTQAYFHGCWGRAGHDLFGIGGREPQRGHELRETYWGFDAGFAPMRRGNDLVWAQQGKTDEERREIHYRASECPQGQFLVHHRQCGGRYTIMAWWDRTQGDTRMACNSCYIVDVPAASTTDLLHWFPRHFPERAKCLEQAGVQLVEVKP